MSGRRSRWMILATALAAAVVLIARTAAAADGEVRDPRCGLWCLYVALRGLDFEIPDPQALEVKLGSPTPQGFSLAQLETAAQDCGAETLAVSTTLANLKHRPGRFACIAHDRRGHFVLVSDIKNGQVTVIDPPRVEQIPQPTFEALWDGVALLVSRGPLPVDPLPSRGLMNIWIGILSVLAIGVAAAMYSRRIRQVSTARPAH